MAARRLSRDRRGGRLIESLRRRRLVAGAAAVAALPWFVRGAHGADVGRFSLGIASGQPRADGMVLWTRLTGDSLGERETVRWEVAADEKFQRVVARGEEVAEAAWGHSVHAEPLGLEPGRWYWYRFAALGERSAAGRTRTAPAADARASLRFVVASCQRYDVGHYAAWRHAAAENPDFVLFLGDYIYESASGSSAIRRHQGTVAKTLAKYRARYATYKTTRCCKRRTPPRRGSWCGTTTRSPTTTPTCRVADPDFATRRAAAYQAGYWEHMPFPKSASRRRPDMRIDSAWTGAHWRHRPGRRSPAPGTAGAPARPRRRKHHPARRLPALVDPKRNLLGFEQERWLAEGWAWPGLEPARPAIADDALRLGRPGPRAAPSTGTTPGQLRAVALACCVVAERERRGSSSSAATCTTTSPT